MKVPNYKKIYYDIIHKLHPSKYIDCKPILEKEVLSEFDIMEINQRIFGKDKDSAKRNSMHKSYCIDTAMKILEYQKENHLNNSQLAIHFGMSRNTIAKWKKELQSL